MLRSFLLLSLLTICGAFAPSMCQLEPKNLIPPALKQLKYDIPIPVKPKLKLSDLPRPDTKIICVATFARKGIVIRHESKLLRRALSHAHRPSFCTAFSISFLLPAFTNAISLLSFAFLRAS